MILVAAFIHDILFGSWKARNKQLMTLPKGLEYH